MTSPDTNRLCRNILLESFGEIVEKVASTLITRGRLTTPQLRKVTDLATPLILRALFVLMQQNIVFQAEQLDGPTLNFYYSVEVLEILQRNRFPVYFEVAVDVAGPLAGTVVKYLFVHGKLSLRALIAELAKSDDEAERSISESQVRQMFQRLNFEAFLSTIRPSDTVAIADKRLAFLKGEIEKGVTIQEKKKILLKIEGMVDFEDVYQSGRKRAMNEVEDRFDSYKRQRIEECNMDECMHRLNYERFHVHIRNQQYVETAKTKFGVIAGLIVSTFLDLAMSGDFEVKNLCPNNVTVGELATTICRSGNLEMQSKRPHEVRDIVKTYIDTMSSTFYHEDDFPNPLDRGSSALFLKVREEKNLPFLPFFRASRFTPNEYEFNFERANSFIQTRLIESMVQLKYSSIGLSIWRALYVSGRLSEQSMSKRMMLDPNACRQVCFKMVRDGIIHFQEIPRTKDYSKNFHLLFIDIKVCRESLISVLCKSICNLKERLYHETFTRKGLLDKAERNDVEGDWEKLPAPEKAALIRYQKFKDALNVEMLRMDREIMFLRDI